MQILYAEQLRCDTIYSIRGEGGFNMATMSKNEYGVISVAGSAITRMIVDNLLSFEDTCCRAIGKASCFGRVFLPEIMSLEIPSKSGRSRKAFTWIFLRWRPFTELWRELLSNCLAWWRKISACCAWRNRRKFE